MSTHLIAMHGWAGDHRAWQPWADLARARGWSFSSGERGYGHQPPHQPAWDPRAGQRVVLAHSFGPHLLPAAVLAQATAVVLLASFGRFVPPGAPGQRLRAALRAMAARLEAGDDLEMLHNFFALVAAPHSAVLLPPGPLQEGIGPEGRRRLLEDLLQLEATAGLPAGFPSSARVLVVEAQDDQVVGEASRSLLRQALPQASLWTLQQAGHALLVPELPAAVLDWVDHGQG